MLARLDIKALPSVFFITGTDTDVGKTWVSATLANQALDVGKTVIYYKPIQTGSVPGQLAEDCETVLAASTQGGVIVKNRYCFEPPVTPSVADTESVIDFEQIASDVALYKSQCDVLIVEGAGGVAVPISSHLKMIDLMAHLKLPVVLVAHSKLGTLNHTLLSVDALTHRQIEIASIVLNYFPEDLTHAPLAIQTLEHTLRQFIPKNTPLASLEQSKKPALMG